EIGADVPAAVVTVMLVVPVDSPGGTWKLTWVSAMERTWHSTAPAKIRGLDPKLVPITKPYAAGESTVIPPMPAILVMVGGCVWPASVHAKIDIPRANFMKTPKTAKCNTFKSLGELIALCIKKMRSPGASFRNNIPEAG